MKNFSSFLVEAEKQSKPISGHRVLTTMRTQPMAHPGHILNANTAMDFAKKEGGDLLHFPSRTQDLKDNPVPMPIKAKAFGMMAPQHKDKMNIDPERRTVVDQLKQDYQDGYKDVTLQVGEDRVEDFENFFRRTNGTKPKSGGDPIYEFDNVRVMSNGIKRDPNSNDPIQKISGREIRKMFKNRDFKSIMEVYNHPLVNPKFRDKLEEFITENIYPWIPKDNKKLQLDNDTRDLYRRGMIFNEGDWVESTIMGFIGQVHRRGANHLICVTEDGYMFKSFITDVIIL